MEIQKLVTGAKLGNNADFDTLVKLFNAPLLASIRVLVRDPHVAEEVVQESFVRAWIQLASLREAAAFPSWLWGIGRNLARSHLRQRRRDPEGSEADMDCHADPRSRRGDLPGDWDQPAWDSLTAGLDREQRLLLELRHVAGLSLREIGAVLRIPEKRVKSRLFSLRRRLSARFKHGLPRPAPHGAIGSNTVLEEHIMDIIHTQRLGAHVFMRLSLAIQSELAAQVIRERSFSQDVLAAIGLVDRGADFVAVYGATIKLPELVGILNNVDRFTERRLVEHLEVVDPEVAGQIKRNMFVFEDIVLFDALAIRLLLRESDPDIFASALAGTESQVREHVLAALDGTDRIGLANRLAGANGDFNLALAAQEAIVHAIKDLERAGMIRVLHPDEGPTGQVFITAAQ